MPEAEAAEPSVRSLDWHLVLLRMAGALPDELIAEARGWLAEGQPADVAQALAFAASSSQLPVLAVEADLMADELTAAGQDAGVVRGLEIIHEEENLPSPWSFSPVENEDIDSPLILDLTTDPDALAGLDDVDRAAVDAADGEAAVSALWRSWRQPIDGSPWPAPRRVFIVSALIDTADDELPALTARLQEALDAAGEENPQVEVCRDDLPVPTYQSMACAHSALLWAAEPAVPIQLARVFDAVDPKTGPMFSEGHPVLEDLDEVARFLDYLDGSLPVLTTAGMMEDILDPERAQVVPLTFRTDGQWIWTDTVSYYLEHYSLAPEEGLLAHLRSVDDTAPTLTDVGLHRVLSFLQRPDDTEPVWVVPQAGERESQPARA